MSSTTRYCGAAVRELVFDDEVLRLLRVDERRDERLLVRHDRRHPLDAGVGEGLLDHRVRTRRDLVDHRPRERDLRLVLEVVEKRGGRKAVLDPRLSDFKDGGHELLAVVRAVVHRDDGHRESACAKALKKQRGDDRHRVARLRRALFHVRLDDRHERAVGAAKLIALLGNREREHLERRGAEDLLEVRRRLLVREIRLDTLGDSREDFARRSPVGIEEDVQGQVVVRVVDLVDHLVVESVARDDAGLGEPLVQEALRKRADEAAKDVARAEVDPLWRLRRRLAHGGDVELRKRHSGGSPGVLFVQYGINVQLHFFSPFFDTQIIPKRRMPNNADSRSDIPCHPIYERHGENCPADDDIVGELAREQHRNHGWNGHKQNRIEPQRI